MTSLLAVVQICSIVQLRSLINYQSFKLLQDLVAQNTAYRNRLRALPTSAFGFENRADPPSARFDPAVALLK
jgi:hypothetical protein